jgi:hypothetical protein
MLAREIRSYIIRPTLEVVSLWSEAAEILVYGTGYIVSNYSFIYQKGHHKNNRIGFWQVSPPEYSNLLTWVRLTMTRPMLERILSTCYYTFIPIDPLTLASNIKLACLICRLHYYRIREDLPDPKDARGLSNYYIKYYNYSHDIDVNVCTETFQRIIDGTE